MPSNLKIRLTSVVIVLVLAATVLVTMVALAMAERDMKGMIGGQQFAVISSAAAFIDDRLDAKKQLMASLANDLPPEARADPRLVQAYLEAHAGLRTGFLNLTAFGRDGRLIASLLAPISAAPISATGKQYFEETLARKKGIVPDMRATDTVARLSGDEFVIILEDLKSEQEVLAVGQDRRCDPGSVPGVRDAAGGHRQRRNRPVQR